MTRAPLLVSFAAALAAVAALTGVIDRPAAVPAWLLWIVAALSAAVAVNELLGKPVPFLRWSFLRMVLGMKHLTREWQVGDGREQALLRHVREHARKGDVEDAIRVIDEFARHRSFLINVGDEKGVLLDAALERAAPRRVLELGTYCGYSSLRMSRRLAPGGHIYSIEFSPANATIARAILEHAGVAGKVTVVVGSLGDGGKTLAELESKHGFTAGSLDFVFIDHAKEAYVPDLELIVKRGWLHPGSVVVADNILAPGAPEYREYMRQRQGTQWRSTEHATHLEYQSMMRDIVLESEYLAPSTTTA